MVVTFKLVVMIIAFAVNMKIVTVAVTVKVNEHSNDVTAIKAVRTKNAI